MILEFGQNMNQIESFSAGLFGTKGRETFCKFQNIWLILIARWSRIGTIVYITAFSSVEVQFDTLVLEKLGFY